MKRREIFKRGFAAVLAATVVFSGTGLERTIALGETIQINSLENADDMEGLSFFERESVEVTDAYYDAALEMDVDNMLKLDADRLLANFRQNAAYANASLGAGKSDYVNADGSYNTSAINQFMKNKTCYGGGWENSLIGGHTLGHYMTAMAQAVVNPGLSEEDRTKAKDRLDEIIDALEECQELTVGTNYEGYIFGATLPTSAFKSDVDLQFDNIEAGRSNIVTQAWVPWYTMHKILAGLNDSYEVAGNEKALTLANKLGKWIATRANGWSTSKQNTVLAIEYGGMNDALYQLYTITNASATLKAEFLKAAHQFDEVALFERVLGGSSNVLNYKHANTTIPKFLGAMARYEVTGEEKYLQYVEAFWQMVIDKHTYITGGNSEDEHFGADCILDAERTDANNETCNTYNMLKLSRRLFAVTGEKKYADYYENTLINAIMSSQNHETGLTMYFQPMATGYHKVFGTLDSNFWCCTGSGYENFTKLQDGIYFKKMQEETLSFVGINLYLASTIDTDDFTLVQTGDLSKNDTMTFEVTPKAGKEIDFSLRLRIPDWVSGEGVTVTFEGDANPYEYETVGEYIEIPAGKIQNDGKFTVKLPMEIRTYNLPDGENTYAFKYGPFVLSAKLGTEKQTTGSHGVSVTVPSSKAVSSDMIGIVGADSVSDFMNDIDQYLVKNGNTMDFTLSGTSVSYVFTTHYNQDTENYGIYWKYYVDADGKNAAAVLKEKQENRLKRVLVSTVAQCGRGQYEFQYTKVDGSSYGLIDNGSVGEDAPNLTRRASENGSFGYVMEAAKDEDNYLLLTFAKEEDGKTIVVKVGNTVITSETLNASNAKISNITLADADQGDYYQVLYKIPASVVKQNQKTLQVLEGGKTVSKNVITVTFAGVNGAESAKICKSVGMLKAFATTNSVKTLTLNGTKLTENSGKFYATVPYSAELSMKLTLADTRGYVTIDGNVVDETAAAPVAINGATTDVKIRTYAEDFKSYKDYVLTIKADYSSVNWDMKSALVAGYTFDEEVDEAYGILKSMSAVSNPVYEFEDGVVDQALYLKGTYGMKLLEDAGILGNSYTITFWMNSKSVGHQYNPTLAAGTFSPEYWLNITTDGRMWSNNGVKTNPDATNAFKANTWHHVALTVDGETEGSVANTVIGNLYVDGVCVYSGDIADGIMGRTNASVYFGVNIWDEIFTGYLDEVMMFDRTLSPVEVSAVAAKVSTVDKVNAAKKVTLSDKILDHYYVEPVPSKPIVTQPKANAIKVSKTSYAKTQSSKAQVISLGAAAKYGKVTYKSSTSKVTIKNGKAVIAKNFTGKATIRISVKATSTYKAATKTVTITVKPAATKIRKKSAGKKSLRLSWKKVSGVSGYEISYAKDKKFKKSSKTKATTKTSYTAKNLSAKTTYYVRIRTYKKVGKTKLVSAWTTIGKIKTN